MKIKTADLIGPALDWAVAESMGHKILVRGKRAEVLFSGIPRWKPCPRYSTEGDTVIDIMEREGINSRALRRDGHPMNGLWLAAYDHGNTGSMVQWVRREDWPRHYLSGPTLRIAVCRCLCAAKLGDEVEVPDELLEK